MFFIFLNYDLKNNNVKVFYKNVSLICFDFIKIVQRY